MKKAIIAALVVSISLSVSSCGLIQLDDNKESTNSSESVSEITEKATEKLTE